MLSGWKYYSGVFCLVLWGVSGPSLAQDDGELLRLLREQAELIRRLEARLAVLEARQDGASGPAAAGGSAETASAPPSPGASASSAPSASSGASSAPTVALRGRLQVDGGGIFGTTGSRDYNSGVAFRRARIGVFGKLSGDFKYQLLVDFADGERIKFDDSYLQYQGWDAARITVGQHKVYHSLDSATSDIHVPFMERSIVSNAFEAGAGGKLGLSAFSSGRDWSFHVGLMGDKATDTDLAHDGWGVNSRATWAPYLEGTDMLHLGASLYYREESEQRVAFAAGPGLKAGNGSLAGSGVVEMSSYRVLGLEAAAVRGAASLQAEYNRADVTGLGALPDRHYWGASVAATYSLTGEPRRYSGRAGAFGRTTPARSLTEGGPGAVELAARYSYLDLEDGGAGDPARGDRLETATLGLNWIPVSHTRLMLNYIYFDVTGDRHDSGHALGVRAQADW